LQAFKAAVTVDPPMGANYVKLDSLYKEGKITMTEVDEAVRYLLTLKFKIGLFDHSKSISLEESKSQINQSEGRALALKAAEESMVLLKNKENILPLDKDKVKKIAVVGPCAIVNYTGDYSGIPVHSVSILEGIKNKFSGEIVYAKGVDLSQNGDTISYNNYQNSGKILPPDHEANMRKIDSAVEVAKDADLIIVAVGENEQYSREA
jgi:beta-glucosidase